MSGGDAHEVDANVSKPCIAAVTIGQSPRDDVVPEMASLVPGARWVEAGALDGLDDAGIARLQPARGEFPLVTRLRDGRAVTVGERAIVPLVERAIARVEADADVVVLLCTGTFDLRAARPIVFPGRLLTATVEALGRGRRIAVLTPHEDQVRAQTERWSARGATATVLFVPPYAPADFADAGRRARAAGASLVVMDCLGYTLAMKTAVASASALPVLLPRSLVARVAAELLNG